MAMNAKMRIGLAGVILATGATAAVAGTPGYDMQLEQWAKAAVASKMGDIRGSYGAAPDIDFVTRRDIEREAQPLGSPFSRDVDNQLYHTFVKPELDSRPSLQALGASFDLKLETKTDSWLASMAVPVAIGNALPRAADPDAFADLRLGRLGALFDDGPLLVHRGASFVKVID